MTTNDDGAAPQERRTRGASDKSKTPRKRRARGDGGLYWDETRQRWIGEVTIGYRPNGKRITRKVSDANKTEALRKLKELRRDLDDGLPVAAGNYTVADAVKDWLRFGLHGRSASTVANYTTLAHQHIVPVFGGRKLRELTAEDLDQWLEDKSTDLSTNTLRDLRSILKRIIARAQSRDKVKRNVALLCEVPTGREGRPSKALTFEQAEAVLNAAEDSPLHAYLVLSLLIGARTEELRALTWSHVDLVGKPRAMPPVPPSIMVWHSVRVGGDTKTRKSRRTLAMPKRAVDALAAHGERQNLWRANTGRTWADEDVVFTSHTGEPLDAANVRRDFRTVLRAAGLKAKEWTPRELRHSFVSLLSADGMPLEQISRLVGHSSTTVTETVYRKQIRPVLLEGAEVMDRLFPESPEAA